MKPSIAVVLSLTLVGSALAQERPAATPPDPAREARLSWFREAKYGLFIHWGLYAIPAGEWKGKPVPGIGEWIMNRAKIPVREYEALAKQWNPVKFDAEAWVRLAQDAGMRYIVITSKHHDGFALFKSGVSDFNVVDATPFKRDIIKELAAACARRGLRFGVGLGEQAAVHLVAMCHLEETRCHFALRDLAHHRLDLFKHD